MVSNLKARLSVVLKADDVVVAESDDAALWQRVLLAINTSDAPGMELKDPPHRDVPLPDLLKPSGDRGSGKASAAERFADSLGLAPDVVVGACDPKEQEPYLHLDMHAWSAVKSQLPARGSKALSPIVVAGTMLALWAKTAGLAQASQGAVHKVLATISLQDKNPTRGLRSCSWLQTRQGGQIVLNPAEITTALLLAKCFCSKDWSPWNNREE